MNPPPSLFDPITGEVKEPEGHAHQGEKSAEPCQLCVPRAAEIEALKVDLAGSEREVRHLRRKVGALEKEAEERRRLAKERPMVEEIFSYWVEKTGRRKKTTKLGEKREKAVVARLRDGYDVAYIKRAIDGALKDAYVKESTGKRYDDLELICRDETKLERFWEAAEAKPVAQDPDEAPLPTWLGGD